MRKLLPIWPGSRPRRSTIAWKSFIAADQNNYKLITYPQASNVSPVITVYFRIDFSIIFFYNGSEVIMSDIKWLQKLDLEEYKSKENQFKDSFEKNPQSKRLLSQFVLKEKFVIILGAGCSMGCGIPNFDRLKKKIILLQKGMLTQTNPAEIYDNIDTSQFEELWESTGNKFRRTIIHNLIPQRPPHFGAYYFLAYFIKENFFPVIVNYNFDSYLEQALHSIGVDNFLTLINGCHETGFIRSALNDQRIPIIIKTHGDYHHGIFALSRKEMLHFSERIHPILSELSAKKIIIIGYSALDYPFMRSIDISTEGEETWFVNPMPPPDYLKDVMDRRRSANNWISLKFDDFFLSFYYGLKSFNIQDEFRSRVSMHHGFYRVTVKIKNRLGLHARAAAKISNVTNTFPCDIYIIFKGDRVNIKSLLGILTLGVTFGDEITIEANGNGAMEAITALKQLIESKFDEED